MKAINILSFCFFLGAAFSAAIPSADTALAAIPIKSHSVTLSPVYPNPEGVDQNVLLWFEKGVGNPWNVGDLRMEFVVTLRNDGRASFWSRVKNKNSLIPYDYSIGCGLRDTKGNVYQLGHEGDVNPLQKETFDTHYVYSNRIAENWQSILESSTMECVGAEGVNLGGIANQLQKLYEKWGPVIEIIAWLL
ncbi:hypothetical protein B0A52_03767 [Exophiala mesophila]|uniref:Uncharacterized protein n=1 Tax=Exophiala mesophila TaxID=212818 RepID=A0A438N739_EXOME|nr:hypothetical protein B0A52_03767 [Exophiala mesophila]